MGVRDKIPSILGLSVVFGLVVAVVAVVVTAVLIFSFGRVFS